MDTENLINQFALKELELNALLEVTQAINNNVSEDSLYKIYNFTLRANLNIKKLALYVQNDRENEQEGWECKTNFGTGKNFNSIELHPQFFNTDVITNLSDIDELGEFEEFNLAIPVSHKDNLLALVFIGGLLQSNIESSGVNTTFIQALSNIIIVAIENKKLARQQLQQEAIKKEMEIARQVQQFLFPKKLPTGDGLEVMASYLPHHSVGGDYYDFILVDDDQFLICVADVSGKGIPAALLMSNFQAALRALARQTTNLEKIVRELNYQVYQSANGENFITFFIAHFDKHSKMLRYINAGHTPPILITSDRKAHQLSNGTLILGSFYPLPFLNPGIKINLDQFFLFGYTDGLTESFNKNDEQYGIERLEKFLLKNSHKNLNDLHRDLFEELDNFSSTKDQHDDITFLSLRVNTRIAQKFKEN